MLISATFKGKLWTQDLMLSYDSASCYYQLGFGLGMMKQPSSSFTKLVNSVNQFNSKAEKIMNLFWGKRKDFHLLWLILLIILEKISDTVQEYVGYDR